MADLSRWGGGIDPEDEPDQEDAYSQTQSTRNYRHGRCIGLNKGNRKRCAAPVSRMLDARRDGLCGTHDLERDPWTVRDDPEKLIILTGRHDALELDDLDPDDVDFDLERIRHAVTTVQEGRND